jgi:hypothetical protein
MSTTQVVTMLDPVNDRSEPQTDAEIAARRRRYERSQRDASLGDRGLLEIGKAAAAAGDPSAEALLTAAAGSSDPAVAGEAAAALAAAAASRNKRRRA